MDFSGNQIILTTRELSEIAKPVLERPDDFDSVTITRLPFMHEVTYWFIDGRSQTIYIELGVNGSESKRSSEEMH